MNNPVKDPLDKLFASLNDAAHENPSAAFVQDLEARLDALEKKRRKPFFAWWIFTALGAVVLVSTYFIFIPNRAKTKVPNKSTTHAQSNSLSATKSTSSTISASTLTSKTNASPPKSFSNNTSSAIASTKLPSSNSFSTSTAISSLSSSIAASTTKDSDVQQETYVINPILLSDEHEKDSVLIVDQPTPVLPKEVAPTKKQVQHLFGLQFGVSAIFSSFEADDILYAFPAPYTAKQIREWRELGERNTSSWDFNLRYQCQFARWGFQTGLNYLEWGEQYKYEVISVEGTNRYQYVQIPLGLSYRVPLQKLTLQPAIGVGLGYGMQRNGSYILPQNNGVALVESRKFVLNAYAQCELIYQVSEQLQFSVSPIYRYAFGQVVSDPYIKNKYQSLGLLTGFMFTLD